MAKEGALRRSETAVSTDKTYNMRAPDTVAK
jgi:hypothetical protein